MQEFIDVYTKHGFPSGRVIESGEKLQTGEYYYHTIVILRGRGGQYLLQQRSMKKLHSPGRWDVTGGGVLSGENGLTAALRELQEELGLTFVAEQLIFGGKIPFGESGILDLWGVSADFTAEDCSPREDEVDGVRMVDYATFRETVKFNKSVLFMAVMDDIHKRLETESSARA